MKNQKGFTLIELLLVVVIIGLMLAVIVPRAWRANIDTKYGLVRQNANELASFGMEWIDHQIMAQDTDALAVRGFYAESLCKGALASGGQAWLPDPQANWAGTRTITFRKIDSGSLFGSSSPETNVQGIIAPEKIPRNPFNGASVFASMNDPTQIGSVVPGALALAAKNETAGGQYVYYAFVFQGTDSTSTTLTDANAFYAGQDAVTIPGLRNGVFFARLRW